MKKVRLIIASLAVMLGVTALPLATVTVSAAGDDPASQIGEGLNATNGGATITPLKDQIKNISNVLLFVLGAIAVIMIIIGGIRYVTSNGDANSVKGAKDTILYSVVGLIVAIMAYAIVDFVVNQAFKQ